jgi:hypothetical protein
VRRALSTGAAGLSGARLSSAVGLVSAFGCGGQVSDDPTGPGFSFSDPAVGSGVGSAAAPGVDSDGTAVAGQGTESAEAGERPLEETSAGVLGTEGCLPAGESRFVHMHLSAPFDFVAWRSRGVFLDGVQTEVDVRGVPCQGAVDAEACFAALRAAWPDAGSEWQDCGQVGCIAQSLVTTRGDVVQVHQSLAAIEGVLGSIDTSQEAVLWADASGYTPRCGTEELFSLPLLTVVEFSAGYRLRTSEMVGSCPVIFQNVLLDVARDGRLSEVSREDHVSPQAVSICVGRRPQGWVPSHASVARADESNEVGHFFARMAALEAAAVWAFEGIAAELRGFGAPGALVARARGAAADEVHHARSAAALARRHGAEHEAGTPNVVPRSELFDFALHEFDFALHNVVEGCVRETFGAAVAAYQAERASDPEVRAMLGRIAADERRHAELSEDIDTWISHRLSPEQHRELDLARRAAVAELKREVAVAPGAAIEHHAGMPGPAQALALLQVLEEEWWAERERQERGANSPKDVEVS